MDIKQFLRKFYPEGNDTRTSAWLTYKKCDGLAKECAKQGFLKIRDNNGVWVYDITQNGKNYRDSQ
ncbi:MAG: hypothetical protein J1E34_03805 [Oscillospiraceae bacterium]|nr:hypothetical protein [Oscillospiraceae bacterium]